MLIVLHYKTGTSAEEAARLKLVKALLKAFENDLSMALFKQARSVGVFAEVIAPERICDYDLMFEVRLSESQYGIAEVARDRIKELVVKLVGDNTAGVSLLLFTFKKVFLPESMSFKKVAS